MIICHSAVWSSMVLPHSYKCFTLFLLLVLAPHLFYFSSPSTSGLRWHVNFTETKSYVEHNLWFFVFQINSRCCLLYITSASKASDAICWSKQIKIYSIRRKVDMLGANMMGKRLDHKILWFFTLSHSIRYTMTSFLWTVIESWCMQRTLCNWILKLITMTQKCGY